MTITKREYGIAQEIGPIYFVNPFGSEVTDARYGGVGHETGTAEFDPFESDSTSLIWTFTIPEKQYYGFEVKLYHDGEFYQVFLQTRPSNTSRESQILAKYSYLARTDTVRVRFFVPDIIRRVIEDICAEVRMLP